MSLLGLTIYNSNYTLPRNKPTSSSLQTCPVCVSRSAQEVTISFHFFLQTTCSHSHFLPFPPTSALTHPQVLQVVPSPWGHPPLPSLTEDAHQGPSFPCLPGEIALRLRDRTLPLRDPHHTLHLPPRCRAALHIHGDNDSDIHRQGVYQPLHVLLHLLKNRQRKSGYNNSISEQSPSSPIGYHSHYTVLIKDTTLIWEGLILGWQNTLITKFEFWTSKEIFLP